MHKHTSTLILLLSFFLLGSSYGQGQLIFEDFNDKEGNNTSPGGIYSSGYFNEGIYVYDGFGLLNPSVSISEYTSKPYEISIFDACPKVILTFDHVCRIEAQDKAKVQYKLNNTGNWITLSHLNYQGGCGNFTDGFNSASYTNWHTGLSLDLHESKSETFLIPGAVTGDIINIRFYVEDINNDGIVYNDGWLIDNVKLVQEPFDNSTIGFNLSSPVCTGTDLSIQNLNLPPCLGPNDLSWSITGPISTPPSQTGYLPNYTFTTAGTYTVTLTIDGKTYIENITVEDPLGNLVVVENANNCGQVDIHFQGNVNAFASNGVFSYGNGITNSGTLSNGNYIHTYTANGTYTVSYNSDELNCPIFGTAVVTKLPESSFSYNIVDNCDPTLDISLTIANYDPVTYNYQWEINGLNMGASQQTATYINGLHLGSNIIVLKVFSHGYDCIAQSSQEVTLGGDLPEDLFTLPSGGFCENDLFHFSTVSAIPDTYLWTFTSPQGVVSYSTSRYPQVLLTETGTHSVFLTASIAGCSPEVGVQESFVVNAIPEAEFRVTASPSNCGEYTLNFINSIPTGSTVEISYGDGGGLTSNTSHTYNSNGVYEITATVTNGSCESVYTQNIHVNDGAVVSLTASDLFICDGVSSTLTASVTGINGVGNISYIWSVDGVPDPSLGSSHSILVSAADIVTSKVYTVGINNSNGICFLGSNNTASVTISKALIPLTTIDQSTLVGAGCSNTGAVALNVSNFEAVGYNLYGDVSLETEITLDELSAGTYFITLASEHNHSCFSTTEVVIAGSDIAVLGDLTNPSDCNANTGEVDIEITGATGNVTIEVTDDNNQSVPNSDEAMTELAPGLYTITVTDDQGCTATASVSVPTIPVNFTVNTPNNSQLCPDEASVVNVTATSTENVTYQWFGDANETGASVNISSPGVYEVTGSLYGCTNTQSFTIESAPQVGISIATEGQQCVGENALVTATLSGGTYDFITWTNATASTNELVATVNAIPATVSASIEIGGCTYQSNEISLLSVTELASNLTSQNHYDDTQDCEFRSEATGGTAPYTYNWYLQDQTITTYGDPSDSSDPTTTQSGQEVLQVSFSNSTSITNMVDGDYRFEIVDANGCSVSYAPIAYEVPVNTATHPSFSFVWGEEEVKDDEEDIEINEVLRDNMAEASNAVMEAAGKYFQDGLAATTSSFNSSCFQNNSLKDELSISYEENIHHYTLFYYDRAGMLTQTVPPEGVELFDEIQRKAILDYRKGNETLGDTKSHAALINHQELLPDHNLRTHYWYNNLGQMIRQHTPDGGETNFIYDNLSRLRFSQNAAQQIDGEYSYTKYDDLGRVIEAGQSTLDESSLDFIDVLSANNLALADDNSFPGTQTQQVTHSVYTTPAQVTYYGQAQRYLQNRISYVYSDYDGLSSTEEDQYYTYYSYDAHGNVEWLIQEDAEIGKNYMAYDYDLISGKVLKVKYNEQRDDRFYHRYSYDSENRLTGVETSINGELWDEDATYEYYQHGPLMRTVIGEDKVQGIDYAYTIQGWLKSINTAHLARGTNNTPGADGNNVGTTAWETSNVAKDVYGMTLGYFQGDYRNTNRQYLNSNNLYASSESPNLLTGDDAKDLYNGNISHWINSRLKQTGSNPIVESNYTNATIYRYDILNRIKSSRNYEQNTASFTNTNQYSFTKGYNGSSPLKDMAFATDYSYDANGNLLSLNRNNEGGTPMDELSYGYNLESNRLVNNKLASVNDGVATMFTGVQDIVGDRTYGENTAYDEIGNLILDVADEWINDIKHTVRTEIEWNVSGKIKSIKETITLPSPNTSEVKQLKHISFEYDPLGNRVRKVAKISELESAGNYNGETPEGYTYPLDKIKTTYYVRDAQGNPMAVYSKNYESGNTVGEYTASLKVKEQAIYGSDRVGMYTRPEFAPGLVEIETTQVGGEVSFAGTIEEGVEAISEYQNWITATNKILPNAALENLCQCNIQKMSSDGLDQGSLTSFLGIAENGVAIAENTNHETQFYAVLAKNYLGNEDACLVYDVNGNLMKGVEQIIDVDVESKPVIVNLTGTNKYALITLTNEGVATYHIIDMDDQGYGSPLSAGAVTSTVNEPLTSLSNTANIQYGYHYTGYEDHINNKTVVYTTRLTPLTGQSENLVEVLAIELAENTPVEEHVLWSTVECANGNMGELQIAPNGEKLVWYSHGKNIAAFDHKKATIYEIGLNSDKISSTGVVSSQELAGGSYVPLSGIEYEANSESLIYSQHKLHNTTSNTGGAKLWKYEPLNATHFDVSPNFVYLLGEIKRGLDNKLYIPNVNEPVTQMHNYSSGMNTNSSFYTHSTAAERLGYVQSGSLPTQVYKLIGNNVEEYFRVVGYKTYELKDHLSNVRAVITDEKLLVDEDVNNEINQGDYFSPNIVTFSDYYPFGMLQRSGQITDNNYRYGFGSHEKDDEIKGEGNSYTTTFRQYDPRFGRWLSLDPVTHPQYSPYSAFDNNPIYYRDPSGADSKSDPPKGNDNVNYEGEVQTSRNGCGGNSSYTYSCATVNENGTTNNDGGFVPTVFYRGEGSYLSYKLATDKYARSIKKGKLVYTENYGWIDNTHAFTPSERDFVSAPTLWKQINEESGESSEDGKGFKVTYKQDAYVFGFYPGITKSYYVEKNLSPILKKKVALGILLDVSKEFEQYQAMATWSSSSFSPEDIPSNVLGLYAAMYDDLDRSSILGLVKPLSWKQSMNVYLSYSNTFSSSAYKNKSYLPKIFPTSYVQPFTSIPSQLSRITPSKIGTYYKKW